jgi:hypothetical protein
MPAVRRLGPKITLLLVSMVLTVLTAGCASPCEKVKTQFGELTGPARPAEGDHFRLAIPFELIDHLVQREVAGIPRARLPLPSISGISLGTVSVGIDRVIAMPAPRAELGFRVDVSLKSGRKVLLPIRMKVRVRPQLDPKNAQVVIALDSKSLVALDAELGPGGTKPLTDAIWAQLPSAARMLTNKGQIAELTKSLGDQLVRDAAKLVREELLDDLGEVARIELDLPPIPVDAITVRSSDDDLFVGFHSPLAADASLSPAPRRHAEVPKNLVQLTMSAAAAVALANYEMKKGSVPARFDLDGSPAPDGPLQAVLAWDGSTKTKPLRVHAFLLEPEQAGRSKKDCAHITLGATPALGVDRGHLVLSTRDAKIEKVEGSTAIKAGLFFSGVTRQSFVHAEQIAAQTEFELGGQTFQARVQGAQLRGQNLVLGLTLAPRRARRRR